ncbi:MAG: nitroreductase family protein [Hyphomicrobiales bacterium]|nr:nitroreductase family protein [Hyphomicrobiales bacterium]
MTDARTAFHDLVRRRRSVRRFEKGRAIPRETLLEIAEAARWAPTGANSQCFDLIVVDDAQMREHVLEVFLAQSNRLIDHVKGFPAVKKTYMANTVAIMIVLADARWKAAFPVATSPEWADEYAQNNERILVASIGAVVQNIQLAVTAAGLTSAWLSGGGEDTTNAALAQLLGYPAHVYRAIGTIPIGFPEKDVASRWRRPIGQMLHWNRFDPTRHRPDAMVEHYVSDVRQFAMYRGVEDATQWEDADKRLGSWKAAFTGETPNPSGDVD